MEMGKVRTSILHEDPTAAPDGLGLLSITSYVNHSQLRRKKFKYLSILIPVKWTGFIDYFSLKIPENTLPGMLIYLGVPKSCSDLDLGFYLCGGEYLYLLQWTFSQ